MSLTKQRKAGPSSLVFAHCPSLCLQSRVLGERNRNRPAASLTLLGPAGGGGRHKLLCGSAESPSDQPPRHPPWRGSRISKGRPGPACKGTNPGQGVTRSACQWSRLLGPAAPRARALVRGPCTVVVQRMFFPNQSVQKTQIVPTPSPAPQNCRSKPKPTPTLGGMRVMA